jgi:hypothetical protein
MIPKLLLPDHLGILIEGLIGNTPLHAGELIQDPLVSAL